MQQLAPSLTTAALTSTASACSRIVERLDALVSARTLLCFHARDGRLVLGAKAGSGYASFLREGTVYDSDSIVDWACSHGCPAIVGPRRLDLPPDLETVDLSGREGIGPAAGSRDRVWAVAAPLLRNRGHGLAPEILGALYLERPHTQFFTADELRTVATVAHLAADALARAIFADEMRKTSEIDGLTGLMTPAAFRKRLRDEIAVRRDVALFFIDTDRFKFFNDTYGHAAGDALLRRLANVFSEAARCGGAGIAGRNGGDEFCIALFERTKDAAVLEAERIRSLIETQGCLQDVEAARDDGTRITVSIGVAHYPVDVRKDEPNAADRLLEIADAQMYEAKRAGRNRVEYLRFGALARTALHPGEGPIPRV